MEKGIVFFSILREIQGVLSKLLVELDQLHDQLVLNSSFTISFEVVFRYDFVMIFIIQFILQSHNNYYVMRLPSIKNFWPSQQMGLPLAVVLQVYTFQSQAN
jgi:hypothetical protein